MNLALKEAAKAAAENEVPVGAVVVFQNKIIGRGYDRREALKDPTAHAEIIAMKQAALHVGGWRLCDCDLYVTLEPCPMCAGAMILARIRKLFYGARNHKFGAVETHSRLLDIPDFNHRVEVVGGILEENCAEAIRQFFRNKRNAGESSGMK